MKLLYITNSIIGSGGLERVLSVKASMLAEDFDYEVHLVSLNEKNKMPFFSFSNKIHFHSIEVNGNMVRYFLQYKSGLKKLVKDLQPDLILVCDDGMKGFFLPLLLPTKAKMIYESHASVYISNTRTGLPMLKKSLHYLKLFLAKRFSNVVLLTEANMKEWAVQNVVIIPNPLPFVSADVSQLQRKKVIAVGSYSYNKGYDLLLQIWAKIERYDGDWELNVYGKNTKENLQKSAEGLHLKNIHFYDSVPNIEDKYLESSILVLPSRSEGFGMVLIEAMNCGLPVISFDCPNGPKDIIADAEDGFLIGNGDISAFADKLKLLIFNEDLRVKMGKKARENVQRFSAQNIVHKWDVLFKKLDTKL